MLQHEGLDSCQLCSQPILQIGDFCQPDCELPGPITIKFGQQATPDESVSNIKFDRIIHTAVEGEHGIFPKPQQIASRNDMLKTSNFRRATADYPSIRTSSSSTPGVPTRMRSPAASCARRCTRSPFRKVPLGVGVIAAPSLAIHRLAVLPLP